MITKTLSIQITIPLSTKLGELKEALADEDFFGPISLDRQRIFHLGRELKSGGRSLLKLGLGRFNNHVLHLHIRPVPGSTVLGTTKRRRTTASTSVKTNNTVIDLLDDSDDEAELLDNTNGDKRPRVS
jgi:hypothetical protein